MGRTMPSECEHGTTIDWGDFGPCQDCSEHELGDCPNIVECEQCATEAYRTVMVPVPRELFDEIVRNLRPTDFNSPFDGLVRACLDVAIKEMRRG